ncbi:MAG: hypothetical protein IPP26_16570 [Flavobacteriales bacterium]|nr:hypothetical protein [Flavobacteriales bacterium]
MGIFLTLLLLLLIAVVATVMVLPLFNIVATPISMLLFKKLKSERVFEHVALVVGLIFMDVLLRVGELVASARETVFVWWLPLIMGIVAIVTVLQVGLRTEGLTRKLYQAMFWGFLVRLIIYLVSYFFDAH